MSVTPSKSRSKRESDLAIFSVCKRSLRRLCFYTCLSFCSRGEGLSRPRSREEVGGSGQRVSRPRPRGRLGGSEGVCPGGCPGPGPGAGIQAQGGRCPGPGGGVCLSQYALRQTPPPQQMATAADGMHPTGIHSCSLMFLLGAPGVGSSIF